MPRASRPAASDAASLPNPGADDWLALDRQLCFALYSTSLAMTKLYKPLLAPLGLTYPQYLVMLALWESGASSVGALGQRLALDSGTLTPLLKRLEAQGLVARERDAADERRVVVTPTAAGAALRTRALRVPPEIVRASGCDATEVGALTRQLSELRQALLDAQSH